jgi:TolB-like protein/DNA-binding winged helix-turn-helix (wHTH) protein
MQKTEPDRLIRFGVFELDPRAGELRSKGSRVKLQDQPLQILLALLEKPGQIVTRQELRAKLWQADTFVDFDHGLNAAVKRLRDALGDTAENPRYIETLPRHGYRFIAAKEPDAVQAQKRQSPPRRWGLPVAVAALLSIVAVLFAANAGGLRSKLFSGSAAQPHIRSLAVLPFTNLSGDPQQEYFADAMTEELITELSRIDSLKVISRTSVMQYKGQKKPLPQIGRELSVDALMEGSVLRFGNRVRIAVQLIYAPTDQHVWVETYDRDLGDLLKLQGEIAEAITQQIRLKLTPEQLVGLRRAREVNPEAYQAYLTAVSFDWSRFQGIKAAQTYFEKAIQKDPDFADAYLGLAGSYRRLGEFRWLSPQDAYPPGKQALRKALELDERNCRAHLQLGWLAWMYDWDWQTVEREYKYAIELCPNVAGVYWEYAFYLAQVRH